jgi:hypothetical protein
MGIIGVGQLGAHVADFTGDGGGWLLPAGVVVAGILLLGAHRLPGPIRLAGIVFVAAAALSLLSNNNAGRRDNDGRRGLFRPPTTSAPETFELGARTLHIRGGNGSVIVQRGDAALFNGHVVRMTDDEVRIEPESGNGTVVVRVPEGTALDIAIDNGSVTVLAPTNNADILTDNGSINVQVLDDPTIDAATDGEIVVDGQPEGDDYDHDGTGGEIEIDSDNGAVVISHVKAPEGAGRR